MESDKDGRDGNGPHAYGYKVSEGVGWKEVVSVSSEKITMSAPTFDKQFNKWNHPPANSCTCGCGGGWSTSPDSLIE